MAAITPIGTEFLVNTTTENAQAFSQVSALQDGGYIITWSSSFQDGDGGIYAQRYNADGTLAGGEFLVNTVTENWQSYPQITTLADGSFVIIWQSGGFGVPDGNDIIGQRFDANAVPIAGEFQINTHVALDQEFSAIAALDDGGFIVAWESVDQEAEGSKDGIYAQRFDAGGVPVGGEFLVNTEIDSWQSKASITGLPDGGFVITWMSFLQEGGIPESHGIYGQRYDASGTPVGGEFHINTYTDNIQGSPDIVRLANGNFLVTWYSVGNDGSSEGVFAQLFGTDGATIGGEFQVNTFTDFSQHAPEITALPDGGFVVVWVSGFPFPGGIYAQRFSADGEMVGAETHISTSEGRHYNDPAITVLEDGGFVISWTVLYQDGDAAGIYAQQFDAQLFGTQGADELSDTVGADWMRGRGGDDTLYGLAGEDLMHGGRGDDTLYGGADNDILKGNTGDDTLYGGIGNDKLIGGAGDDILVGGAGRDILKGGAGADTFVFNAISDSVSGANDRIKDFEIGIDQIDLSALIPGSFTFIGDSGFSGTTAEIMAVQKNGNTILRIDVDGDGTADMRIFVQGSIAFSETDFIL